MTHRRRRHLLILVNVACAVAIVASVCGALALPLALGEPAAPTAVADRTPTGLAADDGGPGPVTDYAVIYGRPLRRPLFDAKPTAVVKAKAPEPKLTVALVGTFVEPGFTYAVFRTRAAQEQLVPVGGKIEGAEVLSIAAGSVTVRFHGKEITLRMETGGKS